MQQHTRPQEASYTYEQEHIRAMAAKIGAIDLDPIKIKLMSKKGGENWNRAQADSIEIEYRRFLLLLSIYTDEKIVPSEIVDTFWHYHILDTEKYAADCDAVFGKFVHHFPYFGIRSEQDAVNLQQSFSRTKVLYEFVFGSPNKDEAMAAKCDGGGADGDCYGKCGKISNEVRPAFSQPFQSVTFMSI